MTGGWSRWYAVIDTDRDEGGRRRQVTRSFDTRSQAYDWLASQRQAQEVGGPTVAGYLTGWLATRGDLRASTVASYCGHVSNYLIPLLGDQLLRTLSPADVQALHQQLAAAGVSTELARRIHATLSSALTAAVDQGLLPDNPAQRIRLPKKGRYQASVWSAEQAAKFLAATRYDPHAALWRMALVLGLRRGELLGLRWTDVNASAGTVTVQTTRVAVGAQVVEGPPKSSRSRRVLPLDATTAGMLAQLRHTQIQQHVGWSLGRHVFVDAHGQPIKPGHLSREFTDLVTRLGLPQIRFHDLRHTSATLGLAGGESLKEVSARLGHSSIVVTADTYLSPPDTLARAATVRLAGMLDRSWPPPVRDDKRAA
jgi:integrase